MAFSLTKKQTDFLYYKGKRLNFLSGSVRSGKTYISVLKWVLWIAEQPKNHEFIMVGKTLTTLQRNCFNYILTMIGEANFSYSTGQRIAYIFGRKVYLEGANDERSEQKIRGMTLAGAYCDEVTLYPQTFFSMLLSRLSVAGAKLWATCNPDNPMHYIKREYIDREAELDCICWTFKLTENNFLPKEYIEAVSKEYTGVFYDRFILGKWVKAEGLVYPFFNKSCLYSDKLEPNQVGCEYYVSMDYGTQNPTAMLLWCVNFREHIAYIIKEYYHCGRETGIQKTDSDYYKDLCELVNGYNIESIIIDPSASSFIAEIRKWNRYNVRKANNDVLEGIRKTGAYLKDGKIKINENCPNTIQEFELYSWNPKGIDKDSVIKENDHAMDSIRYFCYTVLRALDW